MQCLRKAERSTPLDSLQKLTERKGARYEFEKSLDPVFGVLLQDQVNEVTAKKVLAALPAYVETLQPERRHFFAQYKSAMSGSGLSGRAASAPAIMWC